MKRNTLNLVVDLVTMVGLLGVVFTGLVIKYVLPAGSPKMGWALFGMGRHDWGGVHFWFTVGIGVLVLLHLALHWRWVCVALSRVFLRRKAGNGTRAWERNLVGVSAFLILVSAMALAVSEAKARVQTGQDVRLRQGQASEAGFDWMGELEEGQGQGERKRRRGSQ